MPLPKLLNWPPSKGPKPPELQVQTTYEVPVVGRSDFTFKQPGQSAHERKTLLEAVMDAHGAPANAPEEKVGSNAEWLTRKLSRRQKYETKFHLNHQVAMVATLTLEQADGLIQGYGTTTKHIEGTLAPKPITVELTYPLELGCELRIKPYRYIQEWGDGERFEDNRMSVGYVLWVAAREYERIYKEWRHYRVWGHEFADLYYEILEIGRGGRAALFIGS